MYKTIVKVVVLGVIIFFNTSLAFALNKKKPNVIIIYADDLGYNDVSCYGMTNTQTPNIDLLAESGIKFNNAYSTNATCTPSRYSLLTGEYAFRKRGTGIAPGDAALIINHEHPSIADMFKRGGYKTAVVGKWHLGLGGKGGPDWNGKISPGPLEIGFDYSFLIPATNDRVPCVYVENHNVVGLENDDPIEVSYQHKVGNKPTGAENPELLIYPYVPGGHKNTIVNGISRIGWMSGGENALWKDEEMADVLVERASDFILTNKDAPFFLYFSTCDIHTPRFPNSRFRGKSGMGYRGDAILQLDWCVGEISRLLKENELDENTLIVFSSDNGPALINGYLDGSIEDARGHQPAGELRGGKASAFEGGTRVPFIVSWPKKIKSSKVSNARVSQIDLYASFANLINVDLQDGEAPDSKDYMGTLKGKEQVSREFIVESGISKSIIVEDWKYILPGRGRKLSPSGIETGSTTEDQLYNLKSDIGEKENLAPKYPEKTAELKQKLLTILKTKSVAK